jgi:hypothetical protein
LRAGLVARAALSGISILSGPSPREPKKEGIEIQRVEIRQDFANIKPAPSRDEEYEIVGIAWAQSPGNAETDIKDVRDRVFEFVNEIEAYLRGAPTLGVTGVLWAHLTVVDFTQGFFKSDRNAKVSWRIAVRARI